jgi:hypothetical protein
MESEDRTQSVKLKVPVAPSAVDEFVRGLTEIETSRGRAVLPMATL